MVSEQAFPATETAPAMNPTMGTTRTTNLRAQFATVGGFSSFSGTIRSGPISFNHPIASKVDNSNFFISKKQVVATVR